jgi:hypothetical protein
MLRYTLNYLILILFVGTNCIAADSSSIGSPTVLVESQNRKQADSWTKELKEEMIQSCEKGIDSKSSGISISKINKTKFCQCYISSLVLNHSTLELQLLDKFGLRRIIQPILNNCQSIIS